MSDYNIKLIKLKTFNVEAKFLILPEDKIEQELSIFGSESGKIQRFVFEDFILTLAVVNLPHLLDKVQRNPALPDKAFAFRQELLTTIYDLNPALNPINLYLDKEGNIKIQNCDECIKLTENPQWETCNYTKDKEKDKDNVEFLQEHLRDIDNLEYRTTTEWWDRLRKYIIIKKYSQDNAVRILKSRTFNDKTTFETFIVLVCIEDWKKLFELIENYGVTARIPHAQLVGELYELCHKVNPILTFENAQKASSGESDFREGSDRRSTVRNAYAKKAQAAQEEAKKPSFKDVPRKDLLVLGDRIKRNIIGQDKAIDVLVEAIQRGSVGLKEPNQPIGCFIFAGPTGVGKTETTKVLARELVKSNVGLIKIDCSEYSSDHEYAKLIGAPSGYVGHDEGGVLTNAIKKSPFSVVVFDEIEKASSKVYDLMLQIMDEGILTDGKGVPAHFKDAVVIMTSNIGTKEIAQISDTIGFGDVAEVTQEKRNRALEKALKSKFRPEFLNRVDEVVYFNDLVHDDYLRIIDLELNKLIERLKKHEKIVVLYDKKVRNFIYDRGIDAKYGARPLKRCIKKEFANPLAQLIITSGIEKGTTLKTITNDDEKLVFETVTFKNDFEDPPFYLTRRTAKEQTC